VGLLLGLALAPTAQAVDLPPPTGALHFPAGSAAIGESGIRLLRRHAHFLRAHPGQRVRLEGHTDERGAAEFNLAIGARRAGGVKQMLIRLGATEDQIDTVSCGEEAPRDRRHDASAWRMNRRVELIYDVATEGDQGGERICLQREEKDGDGKRP
jgi:peptidoglycan-associated lipoprotein